MGNWDFFSLFSKPIAESVSSYKKVISSQPKANISKKKTNSKPLEFNESNYQKYHEGKYIKYEIQYRLGTPKYTAFLKGDEVALLDSKYQILSESFLFDFKSSTSILTSSKSPDGEFSLSGINLSTKYQKATIEKNPKFYNSFILRMHQIKGLIENYYWKEDSYLPGCFSFYEEVQAPYLKYYSLFENHNRGEPLMSFAWNYEHFRFHKYASFKHCDYSLFIISILHYILSNEKFNGESLEDSNCSSSKITEVSRYPTLPTFGFAFNNIDHLLLTLSPEERQFATQAHKKSQTECSYQVTRTKNATSGSLDDMPPEYSGNDCEQSSSILNNSNIGSTTYSPMLETNNSRDRNEQSFILLPPDDNCSPPHYQP